MTAFQENIVVTGLANLVPLFFQKCASALIYFTRSLIDRCQIVTDTCKIMFQSSFRSLLKSPLSLRKSKYFGEASLFNLHYLYLNYHILAQKFFSLWKILPLLQPSTKSFGFFFGKNFDKLKEKKVLFTSLSRPLSGKTVPSVLSTVFLNTDLPAGE